MVRVKNSLGETDYNEGLPFEINVNKYVINIDRKYYLFDVIPIGAPRMTQSDKWKTNPNHLDPRKRKRKAVEQYHNYKNILTLQANSSDFKLGKHFEVVFFLPMPDSWSQKKKERNNGMPCEVKPDIDNLLKALCDTLKKDNDADVWKVNSEKRWAYKGSILIYS